MRDAPPADGEPKHGFSRRDLMRGGSSAPSRPESEARSRPSAMRRWGLLPRPTDDPTRENRLAAGEIIQTVVLPRPAAGARSAYRKVKEKESFDWPLVEACVAAHVAGDSIREPRVVLGHVAQVPWRSREAETLLAGQRPSPELFRKAAEAAVAGAKPLGQNGFKVRLARVTLERTLKEAFA